MPVRDYDDYYIEAEEALLQEFFEEHGREPDNKELVAIQDKVAARAQSRLEDLADNYLDFIREQGD